MKLSTFHQQRIPILFINKISQTKDKVDEYTPRIRISNTTKGKLIFLAICITSLCNQLKLVPTMFFFISLSECYYSLQPIHNLPFVVCYSASPSKHNLKTIIFRTTISAIYRYFENDKHTRK